MALAGHPSPDPTCRAMCVVSRGDNTQKIGAGGINGAFGTLGRAQPALPATEGGAPNSLSPTAGRMPVMTTPGGCERVQGGVVVPTSQ